MACEFLVGASALQSMRHATTTHWHIVQTQNFGRVTNLVAIHDWVDHLLARRKSGGESLLPFWNIMMWRTLLVHVSTPYHLVYWWWCCFMFLQLQWCFISDLVRCMLNNGCWYILRVFLHHSTQYTSSNSQLWQGIMMEMFAWVMYATICTNKFSTPCYSWPVVPQCNVNMFVQHYDGVVLLIDMMPCGWDRRGHSNISTSWHVSWLQPLFDLLIHQ